MKHPGYQNIVMNITKLIINTKYCNLKLDHHMLCVPHKPLFVKSVGACPIAPCPHTSHPKTHLTSCTIDVSSWKSRCVHEWAISLLYDRRVGKTKKRRRMKVTMCNALC